MISGYETLTDGMTLDLSKLPAHLTVVADVNGLVTSAKFSLSDGSINRVDSQSKYSLTASNGNSFNAWNPSSNLSSVKLSTHALHEGRRGRTAGATKMLTLKLKRSTTSKCRWFKPDPHPDASSRPDSLGPTGGAGAPTIKAKVISTTVVAGQAFHAEATSTVVPGYQAEDLAVRLGLWRPDRPLEQPSRLQLRPRL